MTTKDVFDHHLAAFLAGDIEETMRDYDDASVFISANGISKGRDEIRAGFERLFGSIFAPGTYTFTTDTTQFDGDIAYATWHMEGQAADIALGTDTFVIVDGTIRVQTVAVSVQPKG